MIVLDVKIGDCVTISLSWPTGILELTLEEAESLLAGLPEVVERAKAADRDARLAEIRRLEERLDALRGQVAREAPKTAPWTDRELCHLPAVAEPSEPQAPYGSLAELDETI